MDRAPRIYNLSFASADNLRRALLNAEISNIFTMKGKRMNNEETRAEEALPRKSSFTEKLDNFWYHYKFHTIATIFVAVVVIIFAIQLTTRDHYDVHIMYAGGKTITHNTGENDDYSQILSSLKRVTGDYDENGESTPNFLNLFVPSEEEIAVLEEEGSLDMLYSLISSDSDSFKNTMIFSSEYYVCFISEELFLEYDKDQGSDKSGPLYPFMDMASYTDPVKEYEYASERGIYLRSTEFYKLPGIKELPEDTVVCLRVRSTVYGSSDQIEVYKNSEEVIKNILSYEIK